MYALRPPGATMIRPGQSALSGATARRREGYCEGNVAEAVLVVTPSLIEVHHFFRPHIRFGRRLRGYFAGGSHGALVEFLFGAQPVFEGPSFGAALLLVIFLREGGDFDRFVEMRAHGGD